MVAAENMPPPPPPPPLPASAGAALPHGGVAHTSNKPSTGSGKATSSEDEPFLVDATDLESYETALKELGAQLFCKPEPLGPVIAVTLFVEWILTQGASAPRRVLIRADGASPKFADLCEKVAALEAETNESIAKDGRGPVTLLVEKTEEQQADRVDTEMKDKSKSAAWTSMTLLTCALSNQSYHGIERDAAYGKFKKWGYFMQVAREHYGKYYAVTCDQAGPNHSLATMKRTLGSVAEEEEEEAAPSAGAEEVDNTSAAMATLAKVLAKRNNEMKE
ncbi:unnamed protein product [Amoebophrya sp. A120]|nr:unnamed protein product [Amoebophrya sp. A120]|eukprot:GSA120T00006660001.1